MGNIKMLVVMLCTCLLSLPSWCAEGDDDTSWEEPESHPHQYHVRCESHYLLSPGFALYYIKHNLPDFPNDPLQDIYVKCIGSSHCYVWKRLVDAFNSRSAILICLPEHHFSRLDYFEQVMITTQNHPDYGFILRSHKQQDHGINITIYVQPDQRIDLAFYYTDSFLSSEGSNVPIFISGGFHKQCVYVDDIRAALQVEVSTELNQVILFLPWCSNTGRFAIGYYRFFTGFAPAKMPSDWNFDPDSYTRLTPNSDCNSKCSDRTVPTLDPATNPYDESVTDAINTVGGLSGAVIGVSVVAGLLLAAILVIGVIFLLWKRNMLALSVKSTADRKAAPTPPKQMEDNPSEGAYSQPYDNIRTPDILERNDSTGNLYTELTKDRKRPPLTSGSSLHIEENDLYSGSEDGVPQRGPRDSAGVYIVENDDYDSLGPTSDSLQNAPSEDMM